MLDDDAVIDVLSSTLSATHKNVFTILTAAARNIDFQLNILLIIEKLCSECTMTYGYVLRVFSDTNKVEFGANNGMHLLGELLQTSTCTGQVQAVIGRILLSCLKDCKVVQYRHAYVFVRSKPCSF
jgi:hypothetical protein